MKRKNALLEQVDINKLLADYDDNTDWLLSHTLSPLSEWECTCNKRAIFTVKIYTYYSKNSNEKRQD